MSLLPSAFNAKEHEGMRDFSAIPPGDYVAQITESEKKEARNKGNFYWKLTFKIQEGDFKGRLIWVNLNLINSNPQAVEIANNELSTICQAVGKVAISDTSELHGIPMVVSVKVTPATAQFAEGNAINGYKPMTGVAKPSSPAKEESASEESASKKKPWE